MREIKITAVLNGWKCKVGCQEVVFTGVNELCDHLRLYLLDPQTVEKQWMDTSINRKWTAQPQQATEEPPAGMNAGAAIRPPLPMDGVEQIR